MIQITIDGLGGSGKSTICKRVSERLKILYFDPNMIVNAISLKCVQRGVNPTSENDVSKVLANTKIELVHKNTYTAVFLDGKEVTNMMNHRIVVQSFYALSKLTCVKKYIEILQQEVLKNNDAIVEGLDVGTVDISKIMYKFFLTADVETRVQRKLSALREKNIYDVTYEEILSDTLDSDNNFYIGETSKVKYSDDLNMIDTTVLSIPEIVDKICNKIIKGE